MADQTPRMQDVLQGLNGMADMLLSAAEFFEKQLEEVPDHKRYIAAAEPPQHGSQLASSTSALSLDLQGAGEHHGICSRCCADGSAAPL